MRSILCWVKWATAESGMKLATMELASVSESVEGGLGRFLEGIKARADFQFSSNQGLKMEKIFGFARIFRLLPKDIRLEVIARVRVRVKLHPITHPRIETNAYPPLSRYLFIQLCIYIYYVIINYHYYY